MSMSIFMIFSILIFAMMAYGIHLFFKLKQSEIAHDTLKSLYHFTNEASKCFLKGKRRLYSLTCASFIILFLIKAHFNFGSWLVIPSFIFVFLSGYLSSILLIKSLHLCLPRLVDKREINQEKIKHTALMLIILQLVLMLFEMIFCFVVTYYFIEASFLKEVINKFSFERLDENTLHQNLIYLEIIFVLLVYALGALIQNLLSFLKSRIFISPLEDAYHRFSMQHFQSGKQSLSNPLVIANLQAEVIHLLTWLRMDIVRFILMPFITLLIMSAYLILLGVSAETTLILSVPFLFLTLICFRFVLEIVFERDNFKNKGHKNMSAIVVKVGMFCFVFYFTSSFSQHFIMMLSFVIAISWQPLTNYFFNYINQKLKKYSRRKDDKYNRIISNCLILFFCLIAIFFVFLTLNSLLNSTQNILWLFWFIACIQMSLMIDHPINLISHFKSKLKIMSHNTVMLFKESSHDNFLESLPHYSAVWTYFSFNIFHCFSLISLFFVTLFFNFHRNIFSDQSHFIYQDLVYKNLGLVFSEFSYFLNFISLNILDLEFFLGLLLAIFCICFFCFFMWQQNFEKTTILQEKAEEELTGFSSVDQQPAYENYIDYVLRQSSRKIIIFIIIIFLLPFLFALFLHIKGIFGFLISSFLLLLIFELLALLLHPIFKEERSQLRKHEFSSISIAINDSRREENYLFFIREGLPLLFSSLVILFSVFSWLIIQQYMNEGHYNVLTSIIRMFNG